MNTILVLIGVFGLGWGLAERSNRKDLQGLSRDIDRLMAKVKDREST